MTEIQLWQWLIPYLILIEMGFYITVQLFKLEISSFKSDEYSRDDSSYVGVMLYKVLIAIGLFIAWFIITGIQYLFKYGISEIIQTILVLFSTAIALFWIFMNQKWVEYLENRRKK